MAGLYVHIPFCRKACHYCNFHFSTSLGRSGEVINAIHREIETSPERGRWEVETVYMGGGTPSLFETDVVEGLLSCVRSAFDIVHDAEITLEANPDDMTPEKVDAWVAIGVNRLSVGIQSFRDADLRWMNRAHNAEQALRCVETARNGGVSNLSIDLIYGLPDLDDEAWSDNLDMAISLEVPHLSAYALTVEPRTALAGMIRLGKTTHPSDERQAAQFLMLSERLTGAGYEHYEVSNLAKPGMRSRHNASYWQGVPYLGFGPSAHSYDGVSRRWNVSDNAAYVRAMMEGAQPSESETMAPRDLLNEYLMVSLRKAEGIDLGRIRSEWGSGQAERIEKGMVACVGKGQAERTLKGYRLTPSGWLFADGIASSLFADR